MSYITSIKLKITLLKEKFNNIKNKPLKILLKLAVQVSCILLISNILYILLPSSLKITDDDIFYLSNEVKEEFFQISPDINSIYNKNDLIFTFKNYSYRKPYSARLEKIAGKGKFEYKVRDKEIYFVVTWITDISGSIIIDSVQQLD